MARIRTIKPEFPQSESMGRVSRDARLLFVELWTIADDSGRARAASRMLASLLFPYDNDAPSLIDGWLSELEREGCIRRYEVDGNQYLDIPKWSEHQKIDRPSRSKFPGYREGSRGLANDREGSSLDQGPRTKDQGRDQGTPIGAGPAAPPVQASPSIPNDPDKPAFDALKDQFWDWKPKLVQLLQRSPNAVGALMGKWAKAGMGNAMEVFDRATRENPADPVPWIEAALKARAGQRNGTGPPAPSRAPKSGRVLRLDDPEDDDSVIA